MANFNFQSAKKNGSSGINKSTYSESATCKTCGKPVTKENYNRAYGSNFCSWKCYEQHSKFTKEPNCKCSVCGKPMYLKPFRIKRTKHGVVCSDECKSIQKSKIMFGEGNHQYGLKGYDNASFNGDYIVNQYGYKMKYLPEHPMADLHGRYREHRYIIETQGEFDNKYFKYINGYKVLKKEYHVHHKDEDTLNNNINNLEIVTQSQHTTLHNKNRVIKRDELGRIIGVFKSGELLENPEEDNQQPS